MGKFGCVCIMFLQAVAIAHCAKVAIDMSKLEVIRRVPKQFLSVTMDTGMIRKKWGGIDWRKAIILASHLTPAYLRIGGTSADLAIFERIWQSNGFELTSQHEIAARSPSEDAHTESFGECAAGKEFENFTITAGDLDRLHWFSKSANLSLIFDLNVLLRTSEKDDRWDWRFNARLLYDYLREQKYEFNFELGNEPDRYPHYNRSVTGQQLARDYATLRSVIKDHYPEFSQSTVVGPAVTNLARKRGMGYTYLEEFLKHQGAKHLDAVTVHHYYLDGSTATEADFIDPSTMDNLLDTLSHARELIRKYVTDKPDFPLWLGETSSAYGGGAPGLSDAFAGTFLWMDKLGLSAKHGVDVVIRQSLFGGHYALLDERTDPNPDYWLSLIYKTLVGQTVLNVSLITSPSDIENRTRFYAHCDDQRVAIFGINLLNESTTVTFESSNGAKFELFLLSADKGDLRARTMLLNGEPNRFDGFNVPVLRGVIRTKPVIMAPFTLGFFVFNRTLAGC